MPWAIFEDKPDTKAIIELISSKSGRVAAVVGGALLDEHVRETLLERLRDSGVAQRLLKIEGPLGNLGPKIDLLYLLHAFDKQTYKTLKGLSGSPAIFLRTICMPPSLPRIRHSSKRWSI